MSHNRIEDFFQGEEYPFTFTIKLDGTAQNIAADVVTVRFKKKKTDTDAQAVLVQTADVATQGASGIAIFILPKAKTDLLVPRRYKVGVLWGRTGANDRVVYDDTILVKERVSDL